MPPTVAEVERALERLYIAAEGASLRSEDRRKALQVAALLAEIERAAARLPRKRTLTVVDAAAGKGYVGVLAAGLLFAPANRSAHVVTIERQADRVEGAAKAAKSLHLPAHIELAFHTADVADDLAWPASPDLVVALHACGPASDVVIDKATAAGARFLLLVPCCTGAAVRASSLADRAAARVGMPRHAPVRRRFIQALVDAERTWRLEAAGYETEVVEMCGATVTPHNLLFRARKVGEPARTAAAAAALAKLTG